MARGSRIEGKERGGEAWLYIGVTMNIRAIFLCICVYAVCFSGVNIRNSVSILNRQHNGVLHTATLAASTDRLAESEPENLFNKIEWGGTIGVGYLIAHRLSIDINYSFAFSKVYNTDALLTQSNHRHQVIGFSMAYFYGFYPRIKEQGQKERDKRFKGLQ